MPSPDALKKQLVAAAAENGNHDRALELSKTLLRAATTDADRAIAHFHRGLAHGIMGDYDQSIADFTQALEFAPKDVNSLCNRGNAYLKKGDHDSAIADYTKALKLKPDHVNTLINRGMSYAEKGDYDSALADFTQAVRLDPKRAVARFNRGTAYLKKGDHDRAIADFTKVLELSPNHADALSNRGIAYAKKGDYNRALADYTKALKLKPDHVAALINRGNSFAEKGEYDAAIADYDKALELNVNSADTLNNRAISDFTQAVQLAPDLAVARFNRGNAYLKKGDHDSAIADFNEAARLDPKYAETLNKRVGEYSTLGIIQESKQMSDDIAKRESDRDALLSKTQERAKEWYGKSVALILILMWLTDRINLYQLIPLATVATCALAPYYWQLRIADKDLERRKNALDELQKAFREKTYGLRMDKYEARYEPIGMESSLSPLLKASPALTGGYSS